MSHRFWSRGSLAAAALVGGWILPRLLSLTPQGDLAPTVRLLPLLGLCFWWVISHLNGHDGSTSDPTPGPITLLTTGIGWLALATLAERTGLNHGPRVAMAILFCLIGGLLWSQVPGLIQAFKVSPRTQPPKALFWLPLLLYVGFMPWSTAQRAPDGDEPYYLLVAHSLAYDLDVDLSNNYEAKDSLAFMDRALEPQPGDPVGRDGAKYSRHNALLAVALAIPYRLGGRLAALTVMALLAAALAWRVARLLRRIFPEESRVEAITAAWALFALTPPLLLYGHQVWTEVPAALLLVIGFEALIDDEARASRPWQLAAVVLTLPFLKFRFALLSAMIVVLVARRRLTRSRLLLLVTALLAVGLAIAAVNWHLFGSVLKHYSFDDLRLDQRPLLSYVRSSLGLFFDGAFGLFACAPLWLVLLPAVTSREVIRHPVLRQAGLLLVPYLLLVASRQEWFGGWSPHFRYALVALPFLAAALVPPLSGPRSDGQRTLLHGLGALTAVFTVAWLVVPGWTYNLADGGSHLIDHMSHRTSTDLRALWPSYVRTSLAAWLWPPLLILLTLGAWNWPCRVRSPAVVGSLGLLLGASLLLAGGQHLVTHNIEFEDPQVKAAPNTIFPSRWTPDRQRFPGARILRPGASLRIPVVAGGDRLDLRLNVRSMPGRNKGATGRAPFVARTLEVVNGNTVVASWITDHPDEWQKVEFLDLTWEADQPLVLRLEGEVGEPGSLQIDRAELSWR